MSAKQSRKVNSLTQRVEDLEKGFAQFVAATYVAFQKVAERLPEAAQEIPTNG